MNNWSQNKYPFRMYFLEQCPIQTKRIVLFDNLKPKPIFITNLLSRTTSKQFLKSLINYSNKSRCKNILISETISFNFLFSNNVQSTPDATYWLIQKSLCWKIIITTPILFSNALCSTNVQLIPDTHYWPVQEIVLYENCYN